MIKFVALSAWGRDRTAEQWAQHHRRMVALLIALGVLASYPMGVFVMAILAAPRAPVAASPAPIHGAGIVLSMNDAMDAITVQHSGVPALNLAPGTTSFRADRAVFKRTEVGDRIAFTLTPEDGVYAITGAQPAADDGALQR